MKMKIKKILSLHPEIFMAACLMFFVVFLLTCTPNTSVPGIMKFDVGEVVQFKLDGRPVYIIKRTNYDMEYKVRFGKDYTKTWVGEIELEPLSPKIEELTISELTSKLVEADEFKANVKALLAEVEKE